jgi:hypothetical protein
MINIDHINKQEFIEVIAMASNTNLTREIAIRLIKGQEVICPKCAKDNIRVI